jgi:hypothetical protein
MENVIIAPTAAWSRPEPTAARMQINDTIKDSPDAISYQQKIGSILPPNVSKADNDGVKTSNIYQDMRQITVDHAYNRTRDLQIFDKNTLLEKHPMTNISFPDVEGQNLKLIHGWTNV